MRFLFTICLVALLALSCKQAKEAPKPSELKKEMPNEASITDRSIEENLLQEYRYRYDQLVSFVDNENFRWQGFHKGGGYYEYLKELRELQSQDSFLEDKSLSFMELEKLALAYEKSKGVETAEIRIINKRILGIIGPSEKELQLKDSLLKTSGYQVDTLADPEQELSKLTERYYKINRLYTKHFTLRDSLGPLFWEICPQYWKLRNKIARINEPVHKAILDSLLAQPSKEEANSVFLRTLIEQQEDTTLLAIESAIAPIFNLKKDSIGIYIWALTLNYSKEREILQKTTYRQDVMNFSGYHTLFYKKALDSLFPTPLEHYVYSERGAYKIEVRNFGRYEDECLDYYYYDLEMPDKIEENEAFFLSSPFELDLIFQNNPRIDSLINNSNPDICVDCPSSWNKQRTFAKLRGYEDIYFSYAYEAGKKLDEVDTPLRAIFYVKDNLVINLWGKDLDLFGCSCL